MIFDERQHISLRDAHEIVAEEAYFRVRPWLTQEEAKMRFEDAFRLGFDAAARVYAQFHPGD